MLDVIQRVERDQSIAGFIQEEEKNPCLYLQEGESWLHHVDDAGACLSARKPNSLLCGALTRLIFLEVLILLIVDLLVLIVLLVVLGGPMSAASATTLSASLAGSFATWFELSGGGLTALGGNLVLQERQVSSASTDTRTPLYDCRATKTRYLLL